MPFVLALICFSRRSFPVMALKNKGVLLYGLLCFMLFNLSTAWAQSADSRTAEGQSEIKPLQRGDTIPEELWNLPLQVVNHPAGKDTITLDDYRDKKLIILDFGGTICPPCIASLHHLEEMEPELEYQLATIAVSSQTKTTIQQFLQRQTLNVPYVYADKWLKEYFPYSIIPHLVWIRDDRVFQLSGAEDATETNLNAAIQGFDVDLEIKEDQYLYDENEPLLVSDNGGTRENLIYHSLITGYLPGTIGGYTFTPNGMTYRNFTIVGLYKVILARYYGDPGLIYDNRVKFDLEKSLVFSISRDDDNNLRYSYDFFIKGGKGNRKSWLSTAHQDLNNYFSLSVGIRADLDSSMTTCLTLKTIEDYQQKKNSLLDKHFDSEHYHHLQGAKASSLSSAIRSGLRDFDMPFISDVNPDLILSVVVPKRITDVGEFKKLLHKQGFDLVEEERKISVIRFSSTN